jgi:hypothetical protein
MFRPGDEVRFAQSPSGGGNGNPAWDFQFFIRQPQVGRVYRFNVRAAYVPYRSPEDVRKDVAKHLEAMGRGGK